MLGHLIKIFNLTSLALTIIGFYLVPKGVDKSILWICLIIFYVNFLYAIWKPIVISGGIKTYVRIDTFFMIFFYLIYFYPYQLFVLGEFDINSSIGIIDPNVDNSNYAVLASTIGFLAFIIGFGRFWSTSTTQTYTTVSRTYLNSINLNVFVLVILILLLFLNTGLSLFQGSYGGSDTGNVTFNAIFGLVSYFIILAAIAVIYYYYNTKKLNFLTWFFCVIISLWSVALLIIGDRNTFFVIGIILFAGFYTYLKSLSKIKLIVFLILGLVIYQVVEVSRESEKRNLTSIFTALTESNLAEEGIDLSSFMTTTIGTRTTFEIVPKKHDFFFGKFKLVSLATVLPYSSRIFIDENDYYTGSAYVLKEEMTSRWESWDVGTNIITDCYMDFGIPGIVILMFFIGRFGGFVTLKARENINSPKWIFIYLITLGFYSELPRYGFDFPLRSIIWTFLFFWILDFGFRYKRFLHREILVPENKNQSLLL